LNTDRLEDLFNEALQLPVTHRSAWLSGLSLDQTLRAELLALLDADQRTDRFGAELGRMLDGGTAPRAAGSRIGSYRVVRELGRGGMGMVYLAERADRQFEAQVAIKVLHACFSPKEAQRLKIERQILVSMTHPNIARMLDGGETDEGSPFIVMEYIAGASITDAGRTGAAGTRERVAWVRDVARAAHHAHRRLIIHGDIKPANVLMREDGSPVLLDFGVARLLAHASASVMPTERWLTPTYASPEQKNGGALSTATDVYALGLLLVELLTGRPPALDAAGEVALQEVERSKRWRGDLPKVIRKATAIDPEDRYGSAEAFAEDLQRYLDGLPVTARAGGWSYRAGKFLRRHPVSTAAVTTAVLLLAVAVWQLALTTMRALAAERAATEQARVSDATTGFLVDMFEDIDPIAARPLQPGSFVELVDRGRQRLGDTRDMTFLQRSKLLLALGDIYNHLGEPLKAVDVLRHATAAADRAHQPSTVQSELWYKLGNANLIRGQLAEAESAYRTAYRHAEAAADPFARGQAAKGIAHALLHQSKLAEAQAYLDRSIADLSRVRPADDAEMLDYRVVEAELMSYDGRLEEAARSVGEVLAIMQATLSAGDPRRVSTAVIQADMLRELGDARGAEALLRQAIAAGSSVDARTSSRIAQAHSTLSGLLLDAGNWAEAREQAQAAVGIGEKRLDSTDPWLAFDLRNLGSIECRRGNHAAAAALLRRAFDIFEAVKHQTPQFHAQAKLDLAELLLEIDEQAGALALLEADPDTMRSEMWNKYRARHLGLKADWERRFGSAQRARAYLREAGALPAEAAGSAAERARLLQIQGRLESSPDAARTAFEHAAALLADAAGRPSPAQALVLLDLGELERRVGRAARARDLAVKINAVLTEQLDAHSPDLVRLRALLGGAAQGQP
jgi:tetratricopeptide (TPR) repeat protein/predicted Ser/Thr protein kinase